MAELLAPFLGARCPLWAITLHYYLDFRLRRRKLELNLCYAGVCHTCVLCQYAFLGYIGELCQVVDTQIPYLISIINGVCAIKGKQTCTEVVISADIFALNPSFRCKVVVSIEPLMKLYMKQRFEIVNIFCNVYWSIYNILWFIIT